MLYVHLLAFTIFAFACIQCMYLLAFTMFAFAVFVFPSHSSHSVFSFFVFRAAVEISPDHSLIDSSSCCIEQSDISCFVHITLPILS